MDQKGEKNLAVYPAEKDSGVRGLQWVFYHAVGISHAGTAVGSVAIHRTVGG